MTQHTGLFPGVFDVVVGQFLRLECLLSRSQSAPPSFRESAMTSGSPIQVNGYFLNDLVISRKRFPSASAQQTGPLCRCGPCLWIRRPAMLRRQAYYVGSTRASFDRSFFLIAYSSSAGSLSLDGAFSMSPGVSITSRFRGFREPRLRNVSIIPARNSMCHRRTPTQRYSPCRRECQRPLDS